MAGNSFSIYCLLFGSSLLGKQLNRYCLPWGTCVSVHPWLAASGSSPTWFPIEGICLQSYDKLRVLTSILRIQKNAKSSTTLTTGQDSLNLTELECVKQGWQPLWIGLKKKMSRRLIQEKEIAPTSFQMTAEKAPHPASGRHQGAFPAAGPKKPGQSWTPFLCWPMWVWNGALYQMKYLDPANCFLALSSCRSSWFYNSHRVSPCPEVGEF